MAIKATTKQLNLLTRIERVNFRITHALNRSPGARRVLTWIQSAFGSRWVEWVTGNIVLQHGFERFEKIDRSKGVLVVANHRTFYDQFVIAAKLFRLYGAHHNIYFPVRANFFYDNPLGLFVNLAVASAAMYPPIVRDRRRLRWNLFATELMIDLLRDGRNMIGFHPEGTRNQGADPYALLPAKPGAGEIIYHARPNVIPVFLQGFPETIPDVIKQNRRQKPTEPPLVHMVMGEPMDFSDLLSQPAKRKTYLAISQKIMAEIARLSDTEKALRSQYASSVPTR